MSDWAFVFLSGAAEVVKYNIFLFGIMRFQTAGRKKLFFSNLLLMAVYFVTDGYFYKEVVPLYTALGMQFILSCMWVWVNCGGKWWKCVLLRISTLAIIDFIDVSMSLVGIFVFGFEATLLDTSVRYLAAGNWVSAVFDLALVFIFYKGDFINKWQVKWQDYVIFASALLICGFGLGTLQIYLIEPSGKIKFVLMIVGIVIGIITFALSILAIFALRSKQYYQERNQLIEQYQGMQEEYYQELYQKINELRGFRHDYFYHVNYMNQLCAASEWEALQEYLQSLGKMQRRVNIVSTGNSVVDAVVSYFQIQMQEKGIDLYWFGYLPKQLAMDAIEICALFSNLFENAVEASEQVIQAMGERGLIQVEVKRDEQYIYVEMINRRMPDADTEVLKTKKKGTEHGLGTRNIKTIVDKYHGMIQWRPEEDTMHVEMELMVIKE